MNKIVKVIFKKYKDSENLKIHKIDWETERLVSVFILSIQLLTSWWTTKLGT